MTNGQAIVPRIVIEGTREDWPGGPQTLTPLDPHQEVPNRQITWFGADLAPDDNEVWFRLSLEAVREMPENEPQARGDLLIECLIAWLREDPERQLERRSNFQMIVDDTGRRIEPYGD